MQKEIFEEEIQDEARRPCEMKPSGKYILPWLLSLGATMSPKVEPLCKFCNALRAKTDDGFCGQLCERMFNNRKVNQLHSAKEEGGK